jgi:protein O-GlcNAc transferase
VRARASAQKYHALVNFADPSITAHARDAFDDGERGLAEAICRVQLHAGISGEAARGVHELLARIAASVGRADVQAVHARLARLPAPVSTQPAQAPAAPAPPPASDRFLLIRAWGQGFFADVDHVLGQCLLAEITGRMPMVFWGKESRFGDGVSNAWGRYFEPVSALRFDDVVHAARRGGTLFPPHWNAHNLHSVHFPLLDPPRTRPAPIDILTRKEAIVVSTMHASMAMVLPWTLAGHWLHESTVSAAFAALAKKYLNPTPRILALVDSAQARLLAPHQQAGGKVLAIHLRGGDKVGEDPAIVETCAKVISRTESLLQGPGGSRWRVLVLTDSTVFERECQARLGSRAIFTAAQRSAGSTSLHFDRSRPGPQLGDDVLVDVLLATRCDRFLGLGSSNVSTAVSYLKDWDGQCELIGERSFERANPKVYL